jgi:hypothetical protein
MIINILCTPLTNEEMGPKLSRMVSPDSPDRLKTAFSKGLAPGLSPDVMMTGLYELAISFTSLTDNVIKTITTLPENIVKTAITTITIPRVLIFLSNLPLSEDLIETIITNKLTPNAAISQLAKSVNERLSQIIADNQRRLLECPEIIEHLYLNKSTPMSIAARIIEFAARNKMELSLAAYGEMVRALDLDPKIEDENEDPLDAEFRTIEMDQQFASVEQDSFNPDKDEKDLSSDEKEKHDKKRIIINQLSISAKIRLAQLGNRFHRAQLVRDANKVVSMAAIKSPAITDSEIDEYSKNKQLSDEVIRYICRRKDWVKSYRIKVNLVNNPKTPISISLTFLNFLRTKELQSLSRSRNVAQILRKTASQRVNRRK